MLAFMPILGIDNKIVQGVLKPYQGSVPVWRNVSTGKRAAKDITCSWVSLNSPSTSHRFAFTRRNFGIVKVIVRVSKFAQVGSRGATYECAEHIYHHAAHKKPGGQ